MDAGFVLNLTRLIYCAPFSIIVVKSMTMSEQHQALADALDALEKEMQQQSLWPITRPDAQALESGVPFAADTMPFECWLAFIFIPKMRDLIALKETVPPMQVAPAAEVYLTSAWEIVKKLRIIDGIASQRSL